MEKVYNQDTFKLIKQYFSVIEDVPQAVELLGDDQYHISTFTIEKEILKGFALPLSPKYHLYLARMAKDLRKRPANSETLYYELCIKAEEYLSQNKRSVHHLIDAARKYHQTPFEVLPEMLVHINSYTLFIYDEILMKNKDADENIIAEFQRISKLNCLSEIYLLCFDAEYEKNILFDELREKGLRYLTPYLRWFHSKAELADA
ncbi:MAG: hypothetical protein MJZ76_06855 [Bacteroidales bacterium]|nr:hypothetical protein [Bacteroidales bacterium]